MGSVTRATDCICGIYLRSVIQYQVILMTVGVWLEKAGFFRLFVLPF